MGVKIFVCASDHPSCRESKAQPTLYRALAKGRTPFRAKSFDFFNFLSSYFAMLKQLSQLILFDNQFASKVEYSQLEAKKKK